MYKNDQEVVSARAGGGILTLDLRFSRRAIFETYRIPDRRA